MTAAQLDLFLEARPESVRRSYASMRAITDRLSIPHGYCYRCLQPARCERAHVVDRAFGGSDAVENLVPLCYPCHAQMPIFTLDEEPYAWAWVRGDVKTYFDWRWRQIRRDRAPAILAALRDDPGALRIARRTFALKVPPPEIYDWWLHCWPGANGESTDLSSREDDLADLLARTGAAE